MTSLSHLTIKPLSEDEGEFCLIEFPDFPGCNADGATPEEAIREGCDALLSYTRTLEELGRKVPQQRDAFCRTIASTRPQIITRGSCSPRGE